MSVNITSPLPNRLVVNSSFGYRTDPIKGSGTKQHKGVDLKATSGTPILASASGVVVNNSYDGDGYGHYIVLEHEGYYTLYAHMLRKSSLIVGTQVTRRQQIGIVGSSGSSTGPHLHFEVRIGSGGVFSANPQDPMKYLQNRGSDRFTPIALDDTVNTSGNMTDLSTPYLENSNLESTNLSITKEYIVSPERAAESGSQPLTAFIELAIQGQRITYLPPNYVVSLMVQRREDSGTSFLLNLFDAGWEDLEYLLANNSSNVSIRYGHVGGVSSPTYTARISDYSISFKPSGVLLSVKGVTLGVVDNLQPITLDTKTKNPTEAAKEICRKLKWKVLDENFDESEDIEFSNQDSIALIADYPITYIKNHLCELARRASDGQRGYTFTLDESTNPPTAYFKASEYTEAAHKTYIYMKGVDSPVIDLELTVNGVFGGGTFTTLATEVETSFIDPTTKEVVTLAENLNNVRVTAVGEYSHTSSQQSKSLLDAAGSSKSQMNAILGAKFNDSMPYTGILTVLGDPDHHIGEVIRLITITNEGIRHHTSGLYVVKDITDQIESGIMTTILNIHRSEDIESGIEIVNYKNLLK